jgi:plastocyanin
VKVEERKKEAVMRTLMLSAAVGFALSGLLAMPGRADDRSARSQKEKPSQGKLSTTSVEPYRSDYFFPDESPAKPDRAKLREVELKDDYFLPSYLFIPSGTTVRFINKGRHHHTCTCKRLWESGELGKGDWFSLTFSRKGRYSYYCRHHGDMRGVIEVF